MSSVFPDALRALKLRLGLPLALVIVMWVVEVANIVSHDAFQGFGIRPRTLDGLWGLLFSPFIHANFAHLLANTLPFLVLGWMVALRGVQEYIFSTAWIMVVGGGAVWLLGQPFSNHVGASGVVFGYLGFLLARGVFERSLQAIGLSLLALFLYGGIIWGVLPTTRGVSWEGHLFGLLAGFIAGRLLGRSGARRLHPGG